MTLILSLITDELAMQVADRRLTYARDLRRVNCMMMTQTNSSAYVEVHVLPTRA